MRAYNGKLLIRIPPEIHRELATEAFESGRSMNQLCMEAILARKANKDHGPWSAMARLWVRNRNVRLVKPVQQPADEQP